MKKGETTDEKIIEILKGTEAGLKVHNLCRKHGIRRSRIYRWRSKYAGIGVSEAKQVEELEQDEPEGQTFGGEPDGRNFGLGGTAFKKRYRHQ